MDIIIRNNSQEPIYEQIMHAIKKAIATDAIQENQMLPSIRVLANDLQISVLTVKKAYDELEKEGFIKTVQGKGSFITPKNQELMREEALKQIQTHLEESVTIAEASDIEKKEVFALLEIIYGEEN